MRIIKKGKILAVAATGIHFKIETDWPPGHVRKPWDLEKMSINIPLSRIVRIIPENEVYDFTP